MRLTKIDLSAPEYQVREPQGSAGAPKVLFRRPGGPGDHGRGPPSGDYKANFSAQSMKEREEDYNRARERLGIAEPPPPAYGVRPQMYPPGAGRGFPGGRGPMVQGRGDPAGRGRGRKAVFRDRDRELQDPDYVRGFNRCALGGSIILPVWVCEGNGMPSLERPQHEPWSVFYCS